ncbi:hypothetical protein GLOTRDRAFT_110174 [Gloeophyllum trabeum ATCC 11539]|uniref:QCR10 domain-containing protein n=1 Tax=Gloeophyllum trabeum (strain ATCC 11539 / FP-39264 / Madison 617) TaxID=670483 RepID=S7RUH6_GLOTA|nr:uncharacterized protein GLOTRDRAFT_110174 [Gloeophyllum trabeum ATCC 11539]EPQ58390.1 hypothetical protein GLOTRDRAFT_110174 [Gloeophyllum trabeum ATCC 11539]
MSNFHRLEVHPTPAYKRLGSFSLSSLGKRWGTSLGVWGAGAGITLIYLLSVTPIVKNRLLVKVPVLGRYYEDTTPASDKPF